MATDVTKTNLNIDIGGTSKGYEDAISRVEARTESFAQRIRQKFREDRAQGVGAVERFFQPEELGRSGIEKLFGGGAVAGVATAGIVAGISALDSVSAKVNDITKRMSEGKLAANLVWFEFGKGVPIIGGVFRAAENLAESLNRLDLPARSFVERMLEAHAAAEKAKLEFDQIDKLFASLGRSQQTAFLSESAGLRLKAQQDYLDRFEKIKEASDKADTKTEKDRVDGMRRISEQQLKDDRLRAEQAAGKERSEFERRNETAAATARAGEDRITQIESTARAIRLRAAGQDHEARLEEIRQQYRELERQNDDARRKALEEPGFAGKNLPGAALQFFREQTAIALAEQDALKAENDREQKKLLEGRIFGVGGIPKLLEEFQTRGSTAAHPSEFGLTSADSLTGVQGRFGTGEDPAKETADNTAEIPPLLEDVIKGIQDFTKALTNLQPKVAGI